MPGMPEGFLLFVLGANGWPARGNPPAIGLLEYGASEA